MPRTQIKVTAIQIQPGIEARLDPGKDPVGVVAVRDQIFLVVLERESELVLQHDDPPIVPQPPPAAEIPSEGPPS